MKHADINIDFVVEIDVADEEIIQRMSGRRVHPSVWPYLSRRVQSAQASRQG